MDGTVFKKGPIVAIDGPAGTGKSSATRRLAVVLGFTHVDTGALYRAVAYLAWKKGGGQSLDLLEVATRIAQQSRFEFRFQQESNPANRIYADQEDVTDFIRTAVVSQLASNVSAVPAVRTALLGLQRLLGSQGRTILEGRDIGTVIFPEAEVKFYLTASPEERAKRRLLELEGAGQDVPSYEEVKHQILERDTQDMNRAVAPLKKAEDAFEIDTTHLMLDQVVEKMEQVVRSRCLL